MVVVIEDCLDDSFDKIPQLRIIWGHYSLQTSVIIVAYHKDKRSILVSIHIQPKYYLCNSFSKKEIYSYMQNSGREEHTKIVRNIFISKMHTQAVLLKYWIFQNAGWLITYIIMQHIYDIAVHSFVM